MIKAVLFDLDGTLLPQDCDAYNAKYFDALAAQMCDMGYENTQFLTPNMWKVVSVMAANDGSDTGRNVFFREFSKFYGKRVYDDEAAFDEFYKGPLYERARSECWVDPTAPVPVVAARALGLKTVLATNPFYPKTALVRRLNWAGLDEDDFDLITSYETFAHCKPNLDYFRDVLRILGITADEAIMIGNNVREDMCAEALGIRVFLVTPCLLNPDGADISRYPRGTLTDARDFICSLAARPEKRGYGAGIARLYNEDWAFFSERLAGLAPTLTDGREAVLDLGCGTGNFLGLVADKFAFAEGVDASPEMIELARKNAPTATLAVGDVLSFSSEKKFDLITCNFDMINHLPSLEAFERLFGIVRAHLAAGGAFLFDFLTPGEFAYCDGPATVDDSGIYRKVYREHRLGPHHIRIDITVLPHGSEPSAADENREKSCDNIGVEASKNTAGDGCPENVGASISIASDTNAGNSKNSAGAYLGQTGENMNFAAGARALGSLSVIESVYPTEEILAALKRAGFTSVTLLDQSLNPTDDLSAPRLFAVCRP